MQVAGVRDKLMAWLDQAARRPFEWGVADCVLDAADWLDFACGTKIADSWRGRYSSEAQADALTAPYGGLEAAMRAEALFWGLAVTAQPVFGDVALVTVAGQDKPLAAVLMPSGRWRMKTAAGIALTRDVTVVVAWALPCRPMPPEPES